MFILETDNKKSLIHMIGLNDEYSTKVGSQKYLRAEYELDGKSIAKRVLVTIK